MSLREFLSTLATDPERLAAFQANPDAIMQEAGLTAEEQEVVKSADEQRIRQYLQESDPDDTKSFYLLAIWGAQPPIQE
jgi:hypothetical protein